MYLQLKLDQASISCTLWSCISSETSLSRGCVYLFTALQSNDDWAYTYPSSNICALRGSTVEIRCNYKYPYRTTVEKKLWFTTKHNEPVDLRDDTDYTGRVEYSCFRHSCTWSSCTGTCKLIIKDLRQSDSDVYKFSFTTNQPDGEYTGDPGVTLSVTGKIWLPMSAVCVWVCSCLSVCFYCLCVCGCVGSIKFVLFLILVIYNNYV